MNKLRNFIHTYGNAYFFIGFWLILFVFFTGISIPPSFYSVDNIPSSDSTYKCSVSLSSISKTIAATLFYTPKISSLSHPTDPVGAQLFLPYSEKSIGGVGNAVTVPSG